MLIHVEGSAKDDCTKVFTSKYSGNYNCSKDAQMRSSLVLTRPVPNHHRVLSIPW